MKHTLPAWLDSLSRDGSFIVVGRAGMDLYPNPPGTKTSDATLMSRFPLFPQFESDKTYGYNR